MGIDAPSTGPKGDVSAKVIEEKNKHSEAPDAATREVRQKEKAAADVVKTAEGPLKNAEKANDRIAQQWHNREPSGRLQIPGGTRLRVNASSLNVHNIDTGEILDTFSRGDILTTTREPNIMVDGKVFVSVLWHGHPTYVAFGEKYAVGDETNRRFGRPKIKADDLPEPRFGILNKERISKEDFKDGLTCEKLSTFLKEKLGTEIRDAFGLREEPSPADIIALFGFRDRLGSGGTFSVGTDLQLKFNGKDRELALYVKDESVKGGGFLETPAYVFGGALVPKESMIARMEDDRESRKELALNK